MTQSVNSYSLSECYRQLASIFESLEKANYKAGVDFGTNPEANGWFLSPIAVKYLEKKHHPEFLFIRYNQHFTCKRETWIGETDQGIDIWIKPKKKQ